MNQENSNTERNFALAEIEKALLEADTNELAILMNLLGIEQDVADDIEFVRAGLNGVAPNHANRDTHAYAEAALLSVKNPVAARARLRIAFAISAERKLADELNMTVDKVKSLSDEAATSMYERLWREGKLV